jgi:hypothetical protein
VPAWSVARRAAPNSVAELDCRRTAHTACSSCRTRWTARSAQALVVPGVDGALLLAYTGSVQEKMRPLRVLLLGACVYLALLGPVGAKKKSKRAARLAAKKAAADSFHGSAGAAPWQMEASYMPEDFSGVKVAKDMAIREMFDRIVAGWPGASYVSSSGGGVIKIENFVTEEEAEHLIKIGDEAGLEGSSGTGVKQADGTFKVCPCTAAAERPFVPSIDPVAFVLTHVYNVPLPNHSASTVTTALRRTAG